MPIFLAMTVHLLSLLQMKADAVTEMSRLFPEVQNRYCVIFNALSLLTLYLQNRKLT